MFFRFLYAMTAAVGLVLVAIGVVALPLAVPGWVALGAMAGALVGVHVHGSAANAGAGPDVTPRRAGVREGALAGAATVAACLVLTGLAALLGRVTWIVVVALICAAVPVVWLWWRRHPDFRPGAQAAGRKTGTAPTTTRAAVPGPRAAAAARRQVEWVAAAMAPRPARSELSIQQLCLAWHRSYFALLELPPGPARGEIVVLRAALLDEIERRDPPGFTRWLDGGARPNSDPGRYLSTDHTTDHP